MPCVTGYCCGPLDCGNCGGWIEGDVGAEGDEYVKGPAAIVRAVVDVNQLGKKARSELTAYAAKKMGEMEARGDVDEGKLKRIVWRAAKNYLKTGTRPTRAPKRKVRKDMPKRKKTKSRKVNVPHVEAKAIERRKRRVLARIHRLFQSGQKARARKMAARLARV
jgi:hypothetical protein